MPTVTFAGSEAVLAGLSPTDTCAPLTAWTRPITLRLVGAAAGAVVTAGAGAAMGAAAGVAACICGCRGVGADCGSDIDGDGTMIAGHECTSDRRMADGWSAGLPFTAVGANIVGVL